MLPVGSPDASSGENTAHSGGTDEEREKLAIVFRRGGGGRMGLLYCATIVQLQYGSGKEHALTRASHNDRSGQNAEKGSALTGVQDELRRRCESVEGEGASGKARRPAGFEPDTALIEFE